MPETAQGTGAELTAPSAAAAGTAHLLRGVHPSGRRHHYAVGEPPGGTLIGAVGSLLVRPDADSIPVWLSKSGAVYTDRYRPGKERPPAGAALRWILSPLRWQGYGGHMSRVRICFRRVGPALRHLAAPPNPRVPSTPPGPPVGYLHHARGPGCAPLFAARHPVMGDQLLTTWRPEAEKLGYEAPEVIGYITVNGAASVDPGRRPALPWAWKRGDEMWNARAAASRLLEAGGSPGAPRVAAPAASEVDGSGPGPEAAAAAAEREATAASPRGEPAEGDAPGAAGDLRPAGGGRADALGEVVRSSPALLTTTPKAIARVAADLNAIFDPRHYSRQVDKAFGSGDEALAHYLRTPDSKAEPHPLFDGAWYLSRRTGERYSVNPLADFLLACRAGETPDPGPYFDTAYYYSQRQGLRRDGTNPLVHYVSSPPTERAWPNPFFHDGFYLRTYPDTRNFGRTLLEHFLAYGAAEGRFASPAHRGFLTRAQRSTSALHRGEWQRGVALFLVRSAAAHALATELASSLPAEHHIGALVVLCAAGTRANDDVTAVLPTLENDSALRLFARSAAVLRPVFAVSDVAAAIAPLARGGVPAYYLPGEASGAASKADLREAVAGAKRVFVSSAAAFRALRDELGEYPTRVARLQAGPASASGSAEAVGVSESSRALVDAVQADLELTHPRQRAGEEARRPARPKIVIPCSDWGVSGVNASMEAVGLELRRLGWDVEILFTRSEEAVMKSAEDGTHLPRLPYRVLEREKRGLTGMWQALIAELESSAPVILFMAYDFFGNSVASAVSDRVGTVMWIQADDGDYYEQVYRLGPYCNALVAVSAHIRDRVSRLNPAIGEKTAVIHNSSIELGEVATRTPRRHAKVRLAYCGRLVQYQKRVLDFPKLGAALDRTGVPYEISLIGSFPPDDDTAGLFEEAAREHVADGRIVLRGRLSRAEILDELKKHDFFALLSDFEGLPLCLIEAMSQGCVPVVAASPSGIGDLVTHAENGLGFETRDYDEWARMIVELWEDRSRYAEMSGKARATVRDHFVVERVAGQFDELFATVAEQIASGTYVRPPALHWGRDRTRTGDVLPPPTVHRPDAVNLASLA